jgi:L-fuconolactonase
MRLDSHQHFWHYNPTEYPWIPPGSPLQRDWLPGDLASLHASLGFSGSIAVQARQSLVESEWLLKLADRHPAIRGVVGWADLQNDLVEDQLATLADHPKFVGVRHVVQDEPDDNFLVRPDFVRGLRRLEQFGLTYDLLIFPRQLPAAVALVQQLPNQPFVLDHCAKPAIRSGVISPWRELIHELARFPNVYSKVSGLVTEADHHAWQPDQFHRYLDVVFEAFGEDRLMYGSDWPVCLLAASYIQTLQLIQRHVGLLTPAGQDKFWSGNCVRFYGLSV